MPISRARYYEMWWIKDVVKIFQPNRWFWRLPPSNFQRYINKWRYQIRPNWVSYKHSKTSPDRVSSRSMMQPAAALGFVSGAGQSPPQSRESPPSDRRARAAQRRKDWCRLRCKEWLRIGALNGHGPTPAEAWHKPCAYSGTRTVARKPPALLSERLMSPPCERAMSRAIASPSPVPPSS
jgi:hypothetical protein